MIRITQGRGFQLTFANGWTASVQFGPGNYCQNRDMDINASPNDYRESNRLAGERGSMDAEIAAWPDGGTLVSFGGDTVEGWVPADQVAAFLMFVSRLPRQIEADDDFPSLWRQVQTGLLTSGSE